MKLYHGLPVWQKPKDIFSQIISSLWKGHNNRSDNKQLIKLIMGISSFTLHFRLPYRTVPRENRYLKLPNEYNRKKMINTRSDCNNCLFVCLFVCLIVCFFNSVRRIKNNCDWNMTIAFYIMVSSWRYGVAGNNSFTFLFVFQYRCLCVDCFHYIT